MKKMNEKGHGSYEFLTVAVVVLILSTIILFFAIMNVEKQKINLFKYNAKILGINAVNYDKTVYLYEIISDGLVTNIKNNFSDDEFCDNYESKVEFTSLGNYVTLKCGKYLIYKEYVFSDDYKIYRVTDWMSIPIKGKNVDKQVFYNLYDGNKKFFDEYYEEDLFVKKVSSMYGKKYKSIQEIKKDFDVKSKTMYRKRVLVDK